MVLGNFLWMWLKKKKMHSRERSWGADKQVGLNDLRPVTWKCPGRKGREMNEGYVKIYGETEKTRKYKMEVSGK